LTSADISHLTSPDSAVCQRGVLAAHVALPAAPMLRHAASGFTLSRLDTIPPSSTVQMHQGYPMATTSQRPGERRLSVLHPVLAASLLLALLTPAYAGTGHLAGTATDHLTARPLRDVTVRAYAHDRSVAYATRTERDGSFRITDLPAGAYAVCVPGSASHRPVVVPHVEIRKDATTPLKLQPAHTLNISGDSWLQGYPMFTQSFTTTGLAITGTRIKAFGGAKPITLLWRDLDNAWPERTTLPVGGEGEAHVLWCGNTMPTQPGRQLALEMRAPEGETWVPAVAGRGDVYPGGSATFDGSFRPHSDLGILVMEDNDRLRTNYALQPGLREYRCVSAGQTFVALSRNITFASAQLAGIGATPTFVRFSVHADGPGGEQIGPSKAVAPSDDAAVAWAADEVPVRPQSTYYLHIEAFGEGHFLAAYQESAHQQVCAVFNGTPDRNRDLAATIAGDISDDDFARLTARTSVHDRVPLVNPSFEEGLTGWKRFGQGGDAVGCDDGVIPAWGSRMFGWTRKGEGQDTRVTIYQHVDAEPGKEYVFSGSLYTDRIGGRSSDVKARLIALPAGGDDVRNNQVITTSQWYATEGQWRRGSVAFRATTSRITVGFELEQRWSLESSTLYVDGAYLESTGTP
jgi:hypothetical protein